MNAQMVDTLEALVALRPEWSDLVRRSARATSFQRPEWLVPWADLFLEDQLRTIAVRERGRLVAIAPLYIWRTAQGTRELRFLGSGNTDYQDALVDAEAREAALDVIADAIGAIDGWDLARFEQMPSGAAFLRLPVPRGCDDGRTIAQERCPVIELPADPETLYARLSRGFVRRVRQAQRRAEREGMRMITVTPGEIDRYIQWLIELHARRWHERAQPGVLATERAQTFLRRVAAEFANTGALVLRALQRAEQVVAVMCGFREGRRVQYYLGGFDPAFKHLSPGTVLIAWCIEQAITNGVDEFDFLRGGEPYKYDWGGVDQFNHARIIIRRGLRAHV